MFFENINFKKIINILFKYILKKYFKNNCIFAEKPAIN
jgi:hypothetical protein